MKSKFEIYWSICVQTFFLLENLMNYICNKLEYKDHHIFQQAIFYKKNLIVKIYLTPSWNKKLTHKNLFIF